ncbi:hypothetical protein KC353_g77 [Hortaea werneckii]|nr:hypothetical protein KC353_g77 [Hortaea werneckii]
MLQLAVAGGQLLPSVADMEVRYLPGSGNATLVRSGDEVQTPAGPMLATIEPRPRKDRMSGSQASRQWHFPCVHALSLSWGRTIARIA